MTRIIAGQARGRALKVPQAGTRPTSDRVRESLFSSLDHLLGSWSGRRVLDLYAGSGALGLEALSRGAEHAVAVESNAAACEVIRGNAKGLALPLVVERRDVSSWIAQAADSGNTRAVDVVFLDPPYDVALAEVEAVVAELASSKIVSSGTVVIVEYATRSGAFTWPDGFAEVTDRRFGDTSVTRAIWYVAGNRN